MAIKTINRIVQHLRRAAQPADGMRDSELLDCYIIRRDEAAFAALVRRLGPMVLGVCRRILGNEADAEDAFQATFLVLVRKAGTIHPRGMVSNWLYGVAQNTARKAKAMIHQRRAKEKAAGTRPKAGATEEVWWQVQELLDLELGRLPEKYRVPIVLCELEGKTIKEAARHLDWPQGTVATRLNTGRKLLARRLSRQGLAVSGGALALLFAQETASAAVPVPLVNATVQAAGLLAGGQALTAGAISAPVAALTQCTLKALLLTKLRASLAILLLIGLCVGGGALLLRQTAVAQQARLAELRGESTGQLTETAQEKAEPAKAPGDPANQKAMKELVGTWELVSRMIEGKAIFQHEVKPQLTLKNGSFAVQVNGQVTATGTYKINPAANPAEIDIRHDSGTIQGHTSKCVYELKQDELRIWMAPPGHDGLGKFIAKADSGTSVDTWKRIKPVSRLPGPVAQPNLLVDPKRLESLAKGLREALGDKFTLVEATVAQGAGQTFWLAKVQVKEAGQFVLRCDVKYVYPPGFNVPTMDGATFSYHLTIGPKGAPRLYGGWDDPGRMLPHACVGDYVVLPIRLNPGDADHRFQLPKNRTPQDKIIFDAQAADPESKELFQHFTGKVAFQNQAQDSLTVLKSGARTLIDRPGIELERGLAASLEMKKAGKFNLLAKLVGPAFQKQEGRTLAIEVVAADQPLTTMLSSWQVGEYHDQLKTSYTATVSSGYVALRVGDRLVWECGSYVTTVKNEIPQPAVLLTTSAFKPMNSTFATSGK